MAMSITGLKPDTPCGEHLGLSTWTWSYVRALTQSLCNELLAEEIWEEMIGNDGARAPDGEICIVMADRLDGWLECEECVDHAVAIMTESGRIIDREIVQAEVKEWTNFLRHCGGFAVW